MSIAAMSLMATDFSQMSLEELTALRGTVSSQERDAFKAEMQSRMQAMTPEERSTFRQNHAQGMGHKNGSAHAKMNRQMHQGKQSHTQGIQQRLRDGSGSGNMHKGMHKQSQGRH